MTPEQFEAYEAKMREAFLAASPVEAASRALDALLAERDAAVAALESLRGQFDLDERQALRQRAVMPEYAEFWRGRAGAFEDAGAYVADALAALAAAVSVTGRSTP